MMLENNRIASIELDQSFQQGASAEAEQDRATAIQDLLDRNFFELEAGKAGPYHLILSMQEGRLVFDVRDAAQLPIHMVGLSLSPFRRIVKDYFQICDRYYAAVRNATPAQIETIDMARRGLHNEGSTILMERLDGKVKVDMDTARRLFTLVVALVWRAT
jgi:uncharacterized protein (UPF0262 family)